MEHIAVDLGGRESQICIRDGSGEILLERKVATDKLGFHLKQRPAGRVILETCSEAFAVADKLLKLGHEVRVVPATLVRTLGVGSRRTKTDRRDAQILSEVSTRIDLPSVHIPAKESRRRKSVAGMREALIGARTQLVNCVRGWLRGEGAKVRSGGVETFPKRVRDRLGVEELPAHVSRLLATLDHLNAQVTEADEELKTLANEDPLCRRLMSVPGVGPVTSVRFIAALDQVERFENAHRVEAYLGLVPGEHSSSKREHKLGITKAGPSALRRTLVQAAWSARRARGNHPMQEWANEIEKRRGKRVATTALARKLAGILYALWRDGTTYSPQQASRPLQSDAQGDQRHRLLPEDYLVGPTPRARK